MLTQTLGDGLFRSRREMSLFPSRNPTTSGKLDLALAGEDNGALGCKSHEFLEMTRGRKQPPERRGVTSEEGKWISLRLSKWYKNHGRFFPWRADGASPYLLVIAEVMLAQTSADRVARWLPGFLNQYPSLSQLRRSSIASLETALRPMGLYQRRAKILHAFATAACDIDLHALTLEQWQRQPGVGEYVAAAMRSSLHNEPCPMLDTNVARILDRYAGPRSRVEIRGDRWLQQWVLAVLQTSDSPRELNWAFLDLGAAVCRARSPLCDKCPIALRCRSIEILRVN